MNIEEYRDHCISKAGVTESFPFDKKVLAFKVMGKIFALTNIESFNSINLKCDPDHAIKLREQYKGIKPGYHMNKKHWNSCETKNDINDEMMKKMIDDSYELITISLKKSLQEELKKLS